MQACLKEHIMCYVWKHTTREFVNVCKYNKRVNILPLTRNSHTRDSAVSDHNFAYLLITNKRYQILCERKICRIRVFVVTRRIDKQRPRVSSRWTETRVNNRRTFPLLVLFVRDAAKWDICKYLESTNQVAERSEGIWKRQNSYLRSFRDG